MGQLGALAAAAEAKKKKDAESPSTATEQGALAGLAAATGKGTSPTYKLGPKTAAQTAEDEAFNLAKKRAQSKEQAKNIK